MSTDFTIRSEGDCERVARVIIQWYQNESYDLLETEHSIKSPNERWAEHFTTILYDELDKADLLHEAEEKPAQVIFKCDSFLDETLKELSLEDLDTEDLLDAIEEYFEDLFPEDEDEDDEQEDDNDA